MDRPTIEQVRQHNATTRPPKGNDHVFRLSFQTDQNRNVATVYEPARKGAFTFHDLFMCGKCGRYYTTDFFARNCVCRSEGGNGA